MLVEQDAVWHDPGAQQLTEQVTRVDESGERGFGGTDEGGSRARTPGVDRDADQRDVLVLMGEPETLPAWQLIPAASPGAPHKEQRPLAVETTQPERRTVEVGEAEVRQVIANADEARLGE